MISINTNTAAMAAIQNLNRTDRELQVSQQAISTGKKVANVKDNGAIWAIANRMGNDVSSLDRVRESAERAGAIVDTAISASESIMELLNEMKGKALAATQTGLSASSLSALNADFVQLRDQITSVVSNASFDGTNMVAATPANAVSLGDAAGGNTLTISGISLALGSTTVSVAALQTIGKATAGAIDDPTAALTAVNNSINALGTQMATWGAGSKRIEAHKQFVSKLQDALNTGIGSLVDADLAKESAKLTSLQTKQQLGLQALSIANSGSQNALALFR